MTNTKRKIMAVIAIVVIGVALSGVLYVHSYWMDVKERGHAIVWEGEYEVANFVDNQMRVKQHHGVDEPIYTGGTPDGYHYVVYDDGSCERFRF